MPTHKVKINDVPAKSINTTCISILCFLWLVKRLAASVELLILKIRQPK